MNRLSGWIAVLPALVIPVCLGLIMYLGLSWCIEQEHLNNEWILRYLTGHPVSKVTVALFFIGVASLGLIALDVAGQFFGERWIRFSTPTQDEQPEVSLNDQVLQCAKSLNDLPNRYQSHYLFQRLMDALRFMDRTDSTHDIEEEFKYLADSAEDQQQQRYSLIRILIWATPMLGFLGTVLGISQALGGINVGPDNDFQQMMNGLRGSLYVAFDTTALALTLSMALMFGQFLVDRFEAQLLQLVSSRATEEFGRVFDLTQTQAGNSADQQTEIWKKTIESAEKTWVSTLTDANAVVQENLTEAIDENVEQLAHYLGEAIHKADESMLERWQQWEMTLVENSKALSEHQATLVKKTTVLVDLLEQKIVSDGKQSESDAAANSNQEIANELRAILNVLVEQKQSAEAANRKSDQTATETKGQQSRIAQFEASHASKDDSEVILKFPSEIKRLRGRARSIPQNGDAEVILPFPTRHSSSGSQVRKAA